jgi:hypothetical protein
VPTNTRRAQAQYAIAGRLLLTQRRLAEYLVAERKAHYFFTVKGNQPNLHNDIKFYFKDRGEPDYVQLSHPDHGRIETRKIWTTTELNGYLDFPRVGQAYVIERHSIRKKTGKASVDVAYGITDCSEEQAGPKSILNINPGHWTIENCCHYIIDWRSVSQNAVPRIFVITRRAGEVDMIESSGFL